VGVVQWRTRRTLKGAAYLHLRLVELLDLDVLAEAQLLRLPLLPVQLLVEPKPHTDIDT
jgi:hypothetical protein